MIRSSGVLWGLALREWQGVSRGTFALILIGISTILRAVILVGYGNSLGT